MTLSDMDLCIVETLWKTKAQFDEARLEAKSLGRTVPSGKKRKLGLVMLVRNTSLKWGSALTFWHLHSWKYFDVGAIQHLQCGDESLTLR